MTDPIFSAACVRMEDATALALLRERLAGSFNVRSLLAIRAGMKAERARHLASSDAEDAE